MASHKKKKSLKLDDRFDCYLDASISIREKRKTLGSTNNKVSFVTSQSQYYNVHHKWTEPEVADFLGSLYKSIEPQLLKLLGGNEHVSSDNRFDDGGGGNGFDGNVGDGDFDDVDYSRFVSHLRLDGMSFVLDVPEEGIRVKYDGEEVEDSVFEDPVGSESNFEDWRHLISMDMDLNYEAERMRKGKRPIESNANTEGLKRRGRKPKQPLALSTVVRPNLDFEVKKEEEEDDGYLPDLQRPVVKRPNPVVNVDEWWHKKARQRRNTTFRDKLMDELKKPFSEEEYRMLLKQLAAKKPVQCQRVLRSCTKRYDDETRPPMSMLDHHEDLAEKIDSVRNDHPRVLSLLRGYFYWIMNLTQEGAFLPWEDTECLEVVPQ